MMSIGFPARITVVGESETDFKIAAETLLDVARTVVAQPIIVHGILLENNGAGAAARQFTIENGNSSAILFTATLPFSSSLFIPLQFIADAGLAVTTQAGTSVTIFHSHAGR